MVQRILTQRSSNTDLAQVVQQDPDTVVQHDPTEILQKWSYRILIEVILQDPDKEILRKCPHNRVLVYKCSCRILIQLVQRILTQRSSNTDLAQVVQQDPHTVVQQDPDTVVLQDPDTEILHKWSYRTLTQRSYKWSKRILIQRS